MEYPRIAHIITDLNGFGGTETTLLKYIVSSEIPLQFHKVIVLKSIGTAETVGTQMLAAGMSVVALDQRGRTMSLGTLWRLREELAAFGPDIVSGWLYHSCLMASIFARLLMTRPRVVWHIRSSNFSSMSKSPGRFITQRMLAALSRASSLVLVSNSRAAVNSHAAIDFDVRPERWTFINNGIDTGRFFPSAADRCTVRRELGIPEDALVVGCVGRFAPEKAYDVMWRALSVAFNKMPPLTASRVHFVAIGHGVSIDNADFAMLIPLDLPLEQIHLLEKRTDVARLLRALDLYVLPSISEAFPNSLAEAMSTGLPCIATNAGECLQVLGTQDHVVPRGDADRLALSIADMLQKNADERRMIGERNRQRVLDCFKLSCMVENFDMLFLRMAGVAREERKGVNAHT